MSTAPVNTQEDPRRWVERYYGEVLKSSQDLQTNACCATGAPSPWLQQLLEGVHPDIQARFYGCGFPIPEALEGATVVDLGCGTGRDVFLLSQCVGESGQVVGIDMTEAQLELPRRLSEWHRERFGHGASNVRFHQSYIEALDDPALELAPGSVDVVVSNCVVNLSPRKDLVLQGIAALLRDGGELYISDVVADRRLPEAVARDPLLYSECLGGAMYDFDFEVLARSSGFADPRVVERAPIEIRNPEIQAKVGAARFESVTYRLFKLPSLEPRCEDYGQIATYKGTVPTAPALFRLDDHHLFEAGRPERVCGNTTDMLARTRFAPHFEIVGTRDVHYGVFDCSATMAQSDYADDSKADAAGCC